MAELGRRVRLGVKWIHRRARELRMIARGLASTDHPILAHLVVVGGLLYMGRNRIIRTIQK